MLDNRRFDAQARISESHDSPIRLIRSSALPSGRRVDKLGLLLGLESNSRLLERAVLVVMHSH